LIIVIKGHKYNLKERNFLYFGLFAFFAVNKGKWFDEEIQILPCCDDEDNFDVLSDCLSVFLPFCHSVFLLICQSVKIMY